MCRYSLYNSFNFSRCLKIFIIKHWGVGSLAGAGQRATEDVPKDAGDGGKDMGSGQPEAFSHRDSP